MIEQRQKRLQAHALEVDHRYEQLQRDSRELEQQAGQLDEWHNRLAQDAERLAAEKKARDAVTGQLDQRAAALEGQQAMLASLRTRIERLREELQREEQALGDQRALQEAGEKDLRERTEAARRLRAELDNERELFAEERRRFDQGRATMEAAVAQLRQAQEAIAVQEAEACQRQEQVEATAAAQAEQAALLTARAAQLDEQQARLAADREAVGDREVALTRAEQALAALQEQVRLRSEELAEKLREHGEAAQRVHDEAAQLETRRRTAEEDERLALDRLNLARQEVAGRAAELDAQVRTLAEREEAQRQEARRLEEAERSAGGQRQALAGERLAWEVEKQKAQDEAARRQEELAAARAAAQEMARQVPEMEARAAAALERLGQARAQLRDSLAEMHTYARQGRDDLEAARRQLQAEAERLRQQEADLQAARDEHRLAVAAFRQQLIEWQGQVGEMRHALAQSETQLGRRQAEVEARAQEIASTSARLALQAEQLEQQERQVAERRGEVDRHLADMREWYRRKLRELAGLEPPAGEDAEAAPADGHGILALTGDVEPGDRQLGDLLRSLELIDADTLAALLLEARRQRRTLRQVLLAGGYLTLYQMALIEAGNLDGLVLGPARVIDRLQATPREAVYRVFDPRHNAEALLRHLAESEMEDAVRPDEFRQRFAAAAAVRHPHLAATLEVLEIAGRPAALQEWVGGVPSTEWPALVAAPGVWFRLVSQAALALHTAHAAGLVHGHLHATSFVFTAEGTLKLCGLGEPRWLAVPPPQEDGEPSAAGDLAALGHIAAGWANGSGRSKPLPEPLQEVLRRLSALAPDGYASARELLDDLDRAGAGVPANAAAWERFVRQVREESADAPLRQSA
jgi:chromosome segregation ATPase